MKYAFLIKVDTPRPMMQGEMRKQVRDALKELGVTVELVHEFPSAELIKKPYGRTKRGQRRTPHSHS